MSSEEKSEEEETVIPIFHFNMEEQSITITNPIAQEIFENGYFGQWTSEDTLELEPEEILLLLDRGRVILSDSKTREVITSSEIVTHFSKNNMNFWSRYLVYKDLRNRGYVVQMGTQITAPFRIYPRGGKPGESVCKTVIFPLPEGEEINLDFLNQIVNQAKIDRKKLLLSVVDRIGDVTYYQASQLELEPNELEYEYRDELSSSKEQQNGEK